jgi:hypothetical protein
MRLLKNFLFFYLEVLWQSSQNTPFYLSRYSWIYPCYQLHILSPEHKWMQSISAVRSSMRLYSRVVCWVAIVAWIQVTVVNAQNSYMCFYSRSLRCEVKYSDQSVTSLEYTCYTLSHESMWLSVFIRVFCFFFLYCVLHNLTWPNLT